MTDREDNVCDFRHEIMTDHPMAIRCYGRIRVSSLPHYAATDVYGITIIGAENI